MPGRSATLLLLRDELVGFAKSKVMLALWIVMPAIAIVGYLLLPAATTVQFGAPLRVSATMYISFLISTIAGSIAAVMIAADVVGERTRRVYQLFAIRPIRRDAILWSKFFAVFGCVSIACILSLAVGVVVDMLRGTTPSGAMLYELLKSFTTLAGVIAVSAAEGMFVGILSGTSMVAAVIIVLQVGQILALVPLLPGVFGVFPNQFWFVMLVSFALAAALVQGAVMMFRRAEL